MSIRFASFIKIALPLAAFVIIALVATAHAPARADAPESVPSCGSVNLGTSGSSDAAKSFDCFNTAFARCAPATLVVVGADPSGAVVRTLQTVNGGEDHGCSVSQTIEKGPTGSRTTDATLCRTVARDKDSLKLGGCTDHSDVALRLTPATTSNGQGATGASPPSAPRR